MASAAAAGLYTSSGEPVPGDAEAGDEDEDEMSYKDIEALKAHIFALSDNHMEQVVTLMRGWMGKNESSAKA